MLHIAGCAHTHGASYAAIKRRRTTRGQLSRPELSQVAWGTIGRPLVQVDQHECPRWLVGTTLAISTRLHGVLLHGM
jgi:hypothetical protein